MMLEAMTIASDPPREKPGTGTWVIPTEELLDAHPELAGDKGKIVESERESDTVIVQWNGRRKPYRVPLAYLSTKED